MKCKGTGEICSLYQTLPFIEVSRKLPNVCYIEVQLIINLQNRVFSDLKNYCNNFLVPSYIIATALETQEQANKTAENYGSHKFYPCWSVLA